MKSLRQQGTKIHMRKSNSAYSRLAHKEKSSNRSDMSIKLMLGQSVLCMFAVLTVYSMQYINEESYLRIGAALNIALSPESSDYKNNSLIDPISAKSIEEYLSSVMPTAGEIIDKLEKIVLPNNDVKENGSEQVSTFSNDQQSSPSQNNNDTSASDLPGEDIYLPEELTFNSMQLMFVPKGTSVYTKVSSMALKQNKISENSSTASDNSSEADISSISASVSYNGENITSEGTSEISPETEPTLAIPAWSSEENYINDDIYTGPVIVSAKGSYPVYGTVTSPFGYREHPIWGKEEFHKGIDIAAPAGSDIFSAYPGEVIEKGFSQIYGNYIKIEHSTGVQTVYCHCSKIIADEGTVVREGERIALVGSTGVSTGPHLHFGLIINGRYADPMSIFS